MNGIEYILFDSKLYMELYHYKILEIKSSLSYNIKNDNKEKFLYLFNTIFIHNLTNYILDLCTEKDILKIILETQMKSYIKIPTDFDKFLTVDNFLQTVIFIILHSHQYLNGNFSIAYQECINKGYPIKNQKMDFYFTYQSKEVRKLKNKLELDLIAFQYVKKNKKNENFRYDLPVYVNENYFISHGILNYTNSLIHWLSLAYLKMITQIHDYFNEYYQLDNEKGLNNDSLFVALISLLDVKLEKYPVGLTKSIEVGREQNGKCAFIENIPDTISLSPTVALMLQAKDVFGIVPRIFNIET